MKKCLPHELRIYIPFTYLDISVFMSFDFVQFEGIHDAITALFLHKRKHKSGVFQVISTDVVTTSV